MREFDDIGQVIHEFASEDATVVVGTALDPEMQDEVRVTVVATGLNRAAAVRSPCANANASRSLRRVRRCAWCATRRPALSTTSIRPIAPRRARPCPKHARRKRRATTSTSRRSCAGRRIDQADRTIIRSKTERSARFHCHVTHRAQTISRGPTARAVPVSTGAWLTLPAIVLEYVRLLRPCLSDDACRPGRIRVGPASRNRNPVAVAGRCVYAKSMKMLGNSRMLSLVGIFRG